MSRYLSPRLASLTPYTPGEQPRDAQYIKLNTNESPFPPAPGVMEAITRAEVEKLCLYSDPTARALEDAIAARYGVSPAQVIAGNGSDEILAFAFQAFCDAETGVCFPDITYGFYRVFAQLYGINALEIPLTDAFAVEPEAYGGLGRTLFLANPNAPTGLSLPLADIEGIVQKNPDHVVVIDEAYVDFGGESAVSLIPRYDNLLVVMTFSKSRNLAGARIGFALGQQPLIADLRAIKYSFNPYSLNRLSILAGAAAMADDAYQVQCTQSIIRTRGWTARQLRARGFHFTDSRANFLFASPVRLSGEAYYRRLKEKGVLVRHFAGPRIKDYVRITIGTQAQMQALVDATDAIFGEGV